MEYRKNLLLKVFKPSIFCKKKLKVSTINLVCIISTLDLAPSHLNCYNNAVCCLLHHRINVLRLQGVWFNFYRKRRDYCLGSVYH